MFSTWMTRDGLLTYGSWVAGRCWQQISFLGYWRCTARISMVVGSGVQWLIGSCTQQIVEYWHFVQTCWGLDMKTSICTQLLPFYYHCSQKPLFIWCMFWSFHYDGNPFNILFKRGLADLIPVEDQWWRTSGLKTTCYQWPFQVPIRWRYRFHI